MSRAVSFFFETPAEEAFAQLCEVPTPRLLRNFLIRGCNAAKWRIFKIRANLAKRAAEVPRQPEIKKT